jgi:hypothetical protein
MATTAMIEAAAIDAPDQASVSRIALITTIRGTIARADRLTET